MLRNEKNQLLIHARPTLLLSSDWPTGVTVSRKAHDKPVTTPRCIYISLGCLIFVLGPIKFVETL